LHLIDSPKIMTTTRMLLQIRPLMLHRRLPARRDNFQDGGQSLETTRDRKIGRMSGRTQIQLFILRKTQSRKRLPDRRKDGEGPSPALIPRTRKARGEKGELPESIVKKQAA
jgi:hypothetical protein